MAKARESFPFSGLSGKVGNVVWAQYADGPVVRQHAIPRSPQTPLQVEAQSRTTRVSRTWGQLDAARVERWRRYATTTTIRAANGRRVAASSSRAYNLFSGLATQRLRLDPHVDLLGFDPPVRPFVGDGVAIAASGIEGAILFSGDRPNSPGVVTEIQTQRLPNRNALPSPDKYRFMAFHSFDGEPVAVNVRPGTYACAVRFFDAVTGQSSSPWEVGIVTIQAGGILAA